MKHWQKSKPNGQNVSPYESFGTFLTFYPELDQDKLNPLLRLKYHDSIADAIRELGKPDEIRTVFNEFQQYLYLQQMA